MPPANLRILAPLAALPCAFASGVAHACPDCPTSVDVWAQIRHAAPFAQLGILTVAFGVVASAIVIGVRWVAPHLRLLFAGALLMGAGLGAFIDGIVLHQVLQWHSMLSGVIPPDDLVASKINMFWDGVFHVYGWLAVVVALAVLVRQLPRVRLVMPERYVLGGALAGWGLFNLVEGLIDHHLFGVHHVHPGRFQLAWDLGFLALGVVLLVGGWWLSAKSDAVHEAS